MESLIYDLFRIEIQYSAEKWEIKEFQWKRKRMRNSCVGGRRLSNPRICECFFNSSDDEGCGQGQLKGPRVGNQKKTLEGFSSLEKYEPITKLVK